MTTTPCRTLAALAFLLALLSSSPAMISFGYLSPKQAAEHDLEVRYCAAGPEDVWVKVSFSTNGRWKHFAEPKRYHYIELSLDRTVGKKQEQIFRASLRENRGTADRVSIYFVIERAKLHQASIWLTQRIVDTADVVRMKDYIALDAIDTVEKTAP